MKFITQKTASDIVFIVPDSNETVKKLKLSFCIAVFPHSDPAISAQIGFVSVQQLPAQHTPGREQQ
jgi:hypothetical protein